jgi:hypothetical protein
MVSPAHAANRSERRATVHGHHQAPAVSLPPAAAATSSRGPAGDPKDAHGVRMDFFVDPASGWTCWIPRWPIEAEPAANEGPTAARRPRGQGLVVGLLGRVAGWFGIAEQRSIVPTTKAARAAGQTSTGSPRDAPRQRSRRADHPGDRRPCRHELSTRCWWRAVAAARLLATWRQLWPTVGLSPSPWRGGRRRRWTSASEPPRSRRDGGQRPESAFP